MKKYLNAKLCGMAVILAVLAMVGCSGLQIGVKPLNPFEPPTPEKPCNIYQDLGVTSGLVFSKIKNPCAAQNLLVVVAQEGVILEGYTIDEFHSWSAIAQKYVASGITADTLKVYIMSQVMKMNAKVGLTLFAVSGLIDVFSGDQILVADDVKLAVAALQDLDKKVEQLRPFFSYVSGT